jgi:hypothetical protein
MYAYVYICNCVNMYTCTKGYTYIYICMYVRTCMYLCMYLYVHVCTCMYMHVPVCTCMYARMHACMHACMYQCVRVLLYACIYVYNNIIIVITTMSSHIDVQRQHISCLEDQSAACCSGARKETQMRCAKADNIPSNSE